LRCAFVASAQRAVTNAVPVILTIGDDSGATSVKAEIDH